MNGFTLQVPWLPNTEPCVLGEYGELARQCADFAPDYVAFQSLGFKHATELRNEVKAFCEREGFRFLDMTGGWTRLNMRLEKANKKGINVLLIYADK